MADMLNLDNTSSDQDNLFGENEISETSNDNVVDNKKCKIILTKYNTKKLLNMIKEKEHISKENGLPCLYIDNGSNKKETFITNVDLERKSVNMDTVSNEVPLTDICVLSEYNSDTQLGGDYTDDTSDLDSVSEFDFYSDTSR